MEWDGTFYENYRGCGGPRTTTVIENERIERVEQGSKLVWTGKTYSINELACNESLVGIEVGNRVG